MNAETRAKVKRIQQTIGQLEWQLRAVVQRQQDKGAMLPDAAAVEWVDRFDSGVKCGGAARQERQP